MNLPDDLDKLPSDLAKEMEEAILELQGKIFDLDPRRAKAIEETTEMKHFVIDASFNVMAETEEEATRMVKGRLCETHLEFEMDEAEQYTPVVTTDGYNIRVNEEELRRWALNSAIDRDINSLISGVPTGHTLHKVEPKKWADMTSDEIYASLMGHTE